MGCAGVRKSYWQHRLTSAALRNLSSIYEKIDHTKTREWQRCFPIVATQFPQMLYPIWTADDNKTTVQIPFVLQLNSRSSWSPSHFHLAFYDVTQ
ncbi:unnamed protein product [Timema podura]|uniref:Uncharacterized protein n=1 Tax=Timema podura TaxID=61482 RepID=A0ABN7NQB3_TIMPD|nr:unnamed protein product [Timema podura]